jgi:hypothetical protein
VPNRKGFGHLLSDPPKPLPEEEPPKRTARLVPVPAEEVQTPATALAEEPVAVAQSAPEPAPQVDPSPVAEPAKASDGALTEKRRAATSIRIHQPVADDLEAAWLRAKSVDLRLSYAEYASRIVRRGLQEEAQGG